MNNNILNSVSKSLKSDFLVNLEKFIDKILENNLLKSISAFCENKNLLKTLQESGVVKKLNEMLNSNQDIYYKVVGFAFMLLSGVYLINNLLSYLISLSNSFSYGFLFGLNFFIIFLFSILGNIFLFFMGYKIFFFRKNIFIVSTLFCLITILNMFFSFYFIPYLNFTYVSSLSLLFAGIKFNHLNFILQWLISSGIFLAFYMIYLALLLKNKEKFTS